MLTLLIINGLLSLFLGFVVYWQNKTIGKQQRYVDSLIQKHELRQAELVDRIMYLSGKTWVLPPRETQTDDGEIDEETKLALEGWKEI